jgi:hypothetical protein
MYKVRTWYYPDRLGPRIENSRASQAFRPPVTNAASFYEILFFCDSRHGCTAGRDSRGVGVGDVQYNVQLVPGIGTQYPTMICLSYSGGNKCTEADVMT